MPADQWTGHRAWCDCARCNEIFGPRSPDTKANLDHVFRLLHAIVDDPTILDEIPNGHVFDQRSGSR